MINIILMYLKSLLFKLCAIIEINLQISSTHTHTHTNEKHSEIHEFVTCVKVSHILLF